MILLGKYNHPIFKQEINGSDWYDSATQTLKDIDKLRGNFDKACQAREELPDEVKRLYEAIAWHLQGADVLSNLDIDLIEMTAYAIYRM